MAIEAELRSLTARTNSLITLLERQFKASGAGGSTDPASLLRDAYDVYFTKATKQSELLEQSVGKIANHADAFGKNIDRTNKGLDSFIERTLKMEAVLAIPQQFLHAQLKYGFFQGYNQMGGTGGDIARGSLDRLTAAGNILAVTAGAIATAIGGPRVGVGVGALVQGTGVGTWAASKWSGLNQASTEAATQKTMIDWGEQSVLKIPQQTMLDMMRGRVSSGAANVGTSPLMLTQYDEIMKRTLMNQPELTNTIAEAWRVGGRKGIEGIKNSGVLLDLWEQGLGGTDPGALLAMSSMANRFGITNAGIVGMARRTGLGPSETLPAQIAAQTKYYAFGANVGQGLAMQVAGTPLGGMSVAAGMGFLERGTQGAAQAGQGNDAIDTMLFDAFMEANPGLGYQDFLMAKSKGAASKEWINMLRLVSNRAAKGTDMDKLVASKLTGYSAGEFAGKTGAAAFFGTMENPIDRVVGTETQVPKGRDFLGAQMALKTRESRETADLFFRDMGKDFNDMLAKQKLMLDGIKGYIDYAQKGPALLSQLNTGFIQMLERAVVLTGGAGGLHVPTPPGQTVPRGNVKEFKSSPPGPAIDVRGGRQ